MFKRAVNIVEIAALIVAAVFVVLLFTNEASGGDRSSLPYSADPVLVAGEELYTNQCARCHGRLGGGGAGPQLNDGRMLVAYPDLTQQVAVISNGQGGMPAFGSRLDASEIEAVARYTREALG